MKIKGGCLCGSVRYEANIGPQFSILCCCRRCQKITGTGHASQFVVPKNQVAVTGEPRVYRTIADSGNTVMSAFCSTCGSPIYAVSSGYPDNMYFHAATLDDPSLFQPQLVVWSQSKQPWDHLDPRIAVHT